MTLSDEVQFFSWMAAGITALVTAGMAIVNFRYSIKERRLDLRWKRANAATEFVQEMHSNCHTSGAISILDWLHLNKKSVGAIEGKVEHITRPELLRILSAPDDHPFSQYERQVLLCFDWLFYYIDRMEQNIRDDLFSFDRVKYIFLPYYETISKDRGTFDKFAVDRRYLLARHFWRRFDGDDSWRR
jgi:hypothetical protein